MVKLFVSTGRYTNALTISPFFRDLAPDNSAAILKKTEIVVL